MKKILLSASALLMLSSLNPLDAAPKKKKGKRAPLVIPAVSADKQICFALYTVQDNILKMTAQLYPLADAASREVRLEVEVDGKWKELSKVLVDETSYTVPNEVSKRWTANFRVENWDHTQSFKYRVRHGESCNYEGLIRKDPINKEEIVVAAFTGNSNSDRGLKPDMIHNIKAHDPDLLFFSGDQSYDHRNHLAAWLLFGRQFGEIIRNRPTVSIPDDHDVGQPNLWGHSGRKSTLSGASDGGYQLPVPYVQSVEHAQTSNLPDPYDATPIERGIGVYYTDLNVGGIDFAIVEDRKFKTGPANIIPKMGPRPDHINDPKYDPKTVDLPEAKLLGDRQLKFLNDWSNDWDGVTMKSVLTQSIFAGGAHIHKGKRLLADLDSNGWPQTGRNRALEEIRRGYAFMIGGDQHLATVFHHGVDAHDDAGFSFCVPSIVNYYPRAWHPLEAGPNPKTNALEHTGEFFDGFKNRVTNYAYANPGDQNPAYPKWENDKQKWGAKAAGHGIVRFNKKTRKITMECWPRGVDVTKADAKMYPGWPVTIDQEQNYGRKAVEWLPELKIEGMENAVVEVIDEATGESVYSLRIKGSSFRPKVFKKGSYKIIIGDQKERQKILVKVKSEANASSSVTIKL